MAKDNSNSFNNNSPSLWEPGSNKSFVKKVRSRMSGLLPTSLSKWFSKETDRNSSTVRPREEDDDEDECYSIEPPSKRVKMPSSPASAASLHNNRHINSHSNFNINDTSSRISSAITGDNRNNFRSSTLHEPSSSAGTSGLFSSSMRYSSNSENLLNGDKDSESGESLSGHSSSARVSHNKETFSLDESKKNQSSKPNTNPNSLLNSSPFGGQSRSLFTERSISPQIKSSLSSRRPSFNASTFGSPNFIDRTFFTKSIINSPFYNGRTTYGGASAYDSRKGKSTSIKNQIQVKPVNQSFISDNATLSKTARRILDTLEQYTTPISDAKKIPNPLSKRPRQEGLLSKYTGANPYLMREHKMPNASNKELQIPTVPDLLKMKLKERLQDSTVAVRQIATTSKSSLNCDEYKIKNVEEETPKYTNKMKTKLCPVRHKPENEVMEELKLPEIPLPITTLPKFDFSLPLPQSCSKPLVTVACSNSNPTKVSGSATECQQKVVVMTEPKKSSTADTIEYTFSNPLVLAENLVSIIAINDFKFSDPVCKQKESTTFNKLSTSTTPLINFKAPDSSNTVSKPSDVMSFNFKPSDSTNIILKKKNQDSSSSDLIKTAPQLLTGSIDEFFGKKQEKENKLESSTKAVTSTSTTLNLLDKFKPAAGTWECSSCLLRNTPDKQKCAACETPKEDSSTSKKQTPITETKSDFGKQFKMSSDKWECQECLIRNDNTATKCVACTAPKPGAASNSSNVSTNGPSLPFVSSNWGDKFKPSSSTWECIACMIRNKNETDKCIACETPKPGVTLKDKSSGDASSILLSKSPPSQKFTFGILPNVSDSQVTTTKPNTNISSIFGSQKANGTAKCTITTTSSIPTFTFGVPTKNLENKEVPKEITNKELVFKTPEKLPEKVTITTTSTTPTIQSGFVFGSKPAGVTQQPIKPTNNDIIKAQPEEKKPSIPTFTSPSTGFTFGANNNTNNLSQPDSNTKADKVTSTLTTTTTTTPLSSFTFGANNSSSLKRPANNNDLHSNTKAKKEAPTLSPATSIVFSPPAKQPSLLNKADNSTVLNKPSLALSSGNSNKIDNNNLFGSIATSAAIPAQAPGQPSNSSFAFNSQAPSILPTTTSTTTTTNLFTFGAKTNRQTSSIPMFGNTTTTTTAESSIFKFGAPPSTTSSSTNNQPGFGMTMPQPQPQTNNLFGNTTTTSSVFGAISKPTFEAPSVPPPATNPFGAPPAQPSGFPAPSSEIKPFGFGSPANETLSQPKVSGFSFGQAAPKPADPAKPVFNFGNSAVPPSVPTAGGSGGFSFNANTNNTGPSMNFNFTPSKMENPPPFQSTPASNIFSPQNPVQPQAQPPLQNGGFNFGAAPVNNNAAKTGFNFGVASTPQPPQFNQPQQPVAPAASGVFSFGTPNPNTAPPAGGFNFNTAPAPAFNANMKPTFNFTGGNTPTFSAQPSENPGVAQRKKIRAVRRQR